MITTDISFELPHPIDTVFNYVSNMQYLSAWGEGINAVEQIKGDGPGVGSVYRCTIGPVLPVLGMSGDYEMIEYEMNKKLVCRLNNPMLSFEDTYEFEAKGDSTHLRIVDRLKLPFFLTPAEGLIAPVVRAQIEKDRDNLLKILASVPDGTSANRVA